ncbi:MAG TPA: helical backbone metal receptor [Acidimicrobiales bacterium]|nr:helical backbone metal receptor [Acidimicrobiales bacterium]
MRRPSARALALALAVGLLAPGAVASAAPRGAGAHRRGFPVAIATPEGVARIPARPTRILSLSPSATQMLYAIGAGPQVVGVDRYSTYPPNAPRTSFTGGETSAEDYLSLRPDLVLLAFDASHLVAQLRTLGIPALLLPPATSLAGVDAQLAELGRATGHVAAASRVARTLAQRIARAASAAGSAARGKTYYLELDPTLYSATSKTFVGAIFARLKLRDIADAAAHGSAYPQLSAEYLLRANPDYVFLADTDCCRQSPATFAHRPGFARLRAVRLHHVYGIPDSLASEWGPHSLETLVAVLDRILTARGAHARAARPAGT